LTFFTYAIIKNYKSPDREISAEFNKTNGNLLDQSQVIRLFVLTCKFQEVFGQYLSGHIFGGNQQNGPKISTFVWMQL